MNALKNLIPALLFTGLIISLAWLIKSPDFEPTLTCLSLIGSLASIYIDRKIAAKERRQETLKTVIFEAAENLDILKHDHFQPEKIDGKGIIYPRFASYSFEVAINSGQFMNKKDEELFLKMRTWVKISEELNRRLEITEMYLLQRADNPAEVIEMKKKVIQGEAFLSFKKIVDEIVKHIIGNYWGESGLGIENEIYEKLKLA